MSFKIGDLVELGDTKGLWEVVELPTAKGELRVALGAIARWVSVASVTKHPGARPRSKKDKTGISLTADVTETHLISVDLHGMTVRDALDALDAALNRGLLGDASKIEIIHGIGSGALKKAVHDYLRSCRQVREFNISPFNPGTTVAEL